MIRKSLKKHQEVRATFSGVFIRKGVKRGWRGTAIETLLLNEIKDSNGKLLCDHLWFNYSKGFQSLGKLHEGDVIQFSARCRSYTKGYNGYREDVFKPMERDYRLSHPTQIQIV